MLQLCSILFAVVGEMKGKNDERNRRAKNKYHKKISK